MSSAGGTTGFAVAVAEAAGAGVAGAEAAGAGAAGAGAAGAGAAGEAGGEGGFNTGLALVAKEKNL